MSKYILYDLIEQPDCNWATQNNRGEWSLRDVSSGHVFAGEDGRPACVDHGAMNCVTPGKSIWCCLKCGQGHLRHSGTRRAGTPTAPSQPDMCD